MAFSRTDKQNGDPPAELHLDAKEPARHKARNYRSS